MLRSAPELPVRAQAAHSNIVNRTRHLWIGDDRQWALPDFRSTLDASTTSAFPPSTGIGPRGHGRKTAEVNPGFSTPGFVGHGLLDPENYDCRGADLDRLRAVDFLCPPCEIDATRIAMNEPSQGGGLAIATAALADRRVKHRATAVPFLGDFLHHLQIRADYIPDVYQGA